MRNLLTDVAGLRVGHATDAERRTGATVILAERAVTAAVHVMGGAPGTRETDLLAPEQTVGQADAIVLSGGSAFGLDAAGGVGAALAEAGRGFAVGRAVVPIVPAAILFDLDGGPRADYRALGAAAYRAAGEAFALGSVGAGAGATVANLKGGIGSASVRLPSGFTVAALAAANALGQATVADTRHFWAAPFERDGEFGGLGLPHPMPAEAMALRLKRPAERGANTTLTVLATDAALTRGEAKRLAIAAHDGFARALWPAHTPLDGDIVFALVTGAVPVENRLAAMIELSAAAAAVTARAIARGVYEAAPLPGDRMPTWRQRFG